VAEGILENVANVGVSERVVDHPAATFSCHELEETEVFHLVRDSRFGEAEDGGEIAVAECREGQGVDYLHPGRVRKNAKDIGDLSGAGGIYQSAEDGLHGFVVRVFRFANFVGLLLHGRIILA
jgi:hypothetical protein